jgi:hypothetical protein
MKTVDLVFQVLDPRIKDGDLLYSSLTRVMTASGPGCRRPGSPRLLSPEITPWHKRFTDTCQVEQPDYNTVSIRAVSLGLSLAWHTNTSQILINQGIRALFSDLLLLYKQI